MPPVKKPGADFIILSSLNWKLYNAKVEDLPADGKKWYLTALVIEKTGHIANGFAGDVLVENIYGTFKNVPVGVEQVIGDGVSVWPNPATEFICVDAPESAAIEIFSVDGRLITSVTAEDGNLEDNVLRTISVNNLTAGTYIVNISTVSGSQALKFVKY
jgi:hypothetical protein